MFKNEYTLTVDIKRKFTAIVPTFVQYDNASLLFRVLDDGKPFDLTDFTRAVVTHKRPDGTSIVGSGQIKQSKSGDSLIEYLYQGNEMGEIGFVETSLSLFSADKKVSILPFKVRIASDLCDESITPSNPEYGILQELIAEVSSLVGRAESAVEDAEQAIIDTNVAKDNAQTAADDANLARDGAITATQEALQATQATEQATTAAITATNEATDATQEAIESSLEARDKADLANIATNNANTQANYAKNQGDYAKSQGDIARDEVADLTQLKQDVNTAIQDIESTISETETVRQNTESERLVTEAVRASTESVRVNTESVRLATEQERLDTEAVRIETVTAKDDALLATQNANEASDKANILSENSIHRGGYSDTEEYKKHNEVRFNGSSYVALQDTIGNAPPESPQESNAFWELRAQRGVDGMGSVISVNGISPDPNGNVDLGDIDGGFF